MDRFEALDTFARVVEFGSFTAAANALDVAKSAVSRRIGDLEAHLGVQLFHRTTRKLSLTPSGHGFYEHAKRLLDDLAEAESRVSQEHQELRGRLRIAVPMSFGMRHLSPIICEFGSAHPKIEFDVDFNDRRVDLLQEGFDLAVRVGHLDDSSLIARRLFDAHTVVCAGSDYLAEYGTPRTPDELVDHKGLVYSNVPVPDRWTWRDDAGMKHSVRIPVALMANSGEYLCEAAVANRGIALQPTFIAHQHIARGELVPILTNFDWPITPAYAIYPPTRHLSYRVRTFIDCLVERFAGTPYWDDEVRRALKA